MQVHATGLTPGDIYSVWFIVPDGNGPDSANVRNATGGIVNKHGKATFSGHLSTGPLGAVNDLDILSHDADGIFDDPHGATVILHVVNHGTPGDNEFSRSENMHTIQGPLGGCHQEWVNPPSV